MNQNCEFLEGNDIVGGVTPVDLQTGANDGDWVNLANVGRCVVVVYSGIGTAGDDPILALQQAIDAAGTGAKDLTFTKIRHKTGATLLSAVGQWTKVTQSAAASYDTDPIAGAENEQLLAVEITPDMLDATNGFTWVRGRVADVGGNAMLGCLFYILLDRAYKRETPASLIS